MYSKPAAFWNAKKMLVTFLYKKKNESKNVYRPQNFLTELEVSALRWCYFVVFWFWEKTKPENIGKISRFLVLKLFHSFFFFPPTLVNI